MDIESQKRAHTWGYVRVSTRDQNEDRQLLAMREYGVPENHIFTDRQSGRDFERPEYQQMVKSLRPGNLLVVHSIDRLGRNYEEILKQWRVLTKEIGIDICVLDMPLLDTRQAKDLLGTLISDLVLQLLSFAAENERVNIRQRQAEGIAAAKQRGVRFGRPPAPLSENFKSAVLLWKQGAMSGSAAASSCGMPLSSFRYRAEKYEAECVAAEGKSE